MSKFKTGDKVRYINTDHDTNPNYYPPYGTIGVVESVGIEDYWVQWPNDTTSGDGRWCCNESDIELVVDEKKIIDTHMTNEEIWKMLEPKMRKNGLIPYWGNKELAYYQSDVANAIAIAYRSGYERAMKGRPFKIGEKKKKGGHWEPVDPNNLPKEGTKVRYTRHIDDKDSEPFSKWTGIQIGEETFVVYVCDTFCVKDIHNKYPHSETIVSYKHPERFDMWVEDDE